MKKLFTFISLITLITFNVIAQTSPAELMNRVNTQGTRPPQDRYNMYVDKINQLFIANQWKGDAIVSIKEIIQRPPSDPNDWYYFVSVKTQKCSTPFYISYDIGDSNIGVVFKVETGVLPAEMKAHIDKQNSGIYAERAKEDSIRKAREAKEQAEYQITKNYSIKWNEYLEIRKDEAINYIDDSIAVALNARAKERVEEFILSFSKDTVDMLRENMPAINSKLVNSYEFDDMMSFFKNYASNNMTYNMRPFYNDQEPIEESIRKYREFYKKELNDKLDKFIYAVPDILSRD